MKKMRLLIIVFILLAIGSGATVYAMYSTSDVIQLNSDVYELISEEMKHNEESYTDKILVAGSQDGSCSRCGGSGWVRCGNLACIESVGCGLCNSQGGPTGKKPCPSCR